MKTINVFNMYWTISQSTIITSPTGFNIALTNVDARLKQRCIKLLQRCVTLFWGCFNVGHWRCINVVQRWKSDDWFYFIFNFGSTLFQRWSTALKKRWSDVEMLTGTELALNFIQKQQFSLKKTFSFHYSRIATPWISKNLLL